MPNFDQEKFTPETMRFRAGSTLTNAYQTLGSILAFPSRMLIFANNTGVLLYISWDGVHDHMPLLPGATVVLDENSNAVPQGVWDTYASTQFWVRAPANIAGTDNIYLSTFYAS